jgi:hypothetical protein
VNAFALSLDAGAGIASLTGAQNFVIQFVYPNNDQNNRDVFPLQFKSVGSGSTARFGVGLDVPILQSLAVSGRVYYRTVCTESKETFTVNLTDQNRISPPAKFVSPNTGTGDFRNSIEQDWTWIGVNILVKYFLPIQNDQLYVLAGLEYESLSSDKISLSQTILTSNPKYVTNPSKLGATPNNYVSASRESSSDLYRSSWMGPKIGVGFSVPVGQAILISAEISGAVQIGDLYYDEYKPLDWPTNSVPYSRTTTFSAYNSTTPTLSKYELILRAAYRFGD